MGSTGKCIYKTLIIVGGLAYVLITLIILFDYNAIKITAQYTDGTKPIHSELAPSLIRFYWLLAGAIGWGIIWKIRNVFVQIEQGLVLTAFLAKAILAAAIFCLIDAFNFGKGSGGFLSFGLNNLYINLVPMLLGLYLIAMSWGVRQAIAQKEDNDLTV
jgi:hypothetical protein